LPKNYSVGVNINAYGNAGKHIDAVGQKLKGLAVIQAKFAKMSATIGKVALTGGIAVGAIGAAMKPFLDTASDFETLMATLTAIEGSSEKARKSLDWVSSFAAQTPYDIGQVSEAFKRLRAYGLDPTKGLLKSLGDASSAMGKPIISSIEAVADAVTGENERLKEFGIKARKSGGQIAYEWVNKAGKQMLTSVSATSRIGIQKTLEMIFNNRYAGSMDKLSKTYKGMMSNLGDHWQRFKLKVMSVGAFSTLTGALSKILSTFNKWADDGTMNSIATGLGTLFDVAIKAVAALGPALKDLGKVLTPIWQGFEKFAGGNQQAIGLLVKALVGIAALKVGGSILEFFLPTSIGAVIAGVTLFAAQTVACHFALKGLTQLVGGRLMELPSLGSLAAGGFRQLWTALTAIWAVVQNLHPALKILAVVGAVGGLLVAANWGKIAPVLSSIWATITNVTTAIGLLIQDAVSGAGRWLMSFEPIRGLLLQIQSIAANVGAALSAGLANVNNWANGVIKAHNVVNTANANVIPIAGKRAMGGPVTGGRPYLVGERGPELVVPRRNGYVVPNHALAAGGGHDRVDIHLQIDSNGQPRVVGSRHSGSRKASVTANLGRLY
jgi:hypothetical protein